MTKKLFLPVVLGTVRKGRASEQVAKFIVREMKKRKEGCYYKTY